MAQMSVKMAAANHPNGLVSRPCRLQKASTAMAPCRRGTALTRGSLLCRAEMEEASTSGNSETELYKRYSEAESRQELFNNISSVYDDLNNRLSFGQHWVWKRMTVKWAGARTGATVLDVCCGSGDITLLLSDAVGRGGKVVGLDFAADMLSDASVREKREARLGRGPIEWVQGDAMDMPFDGNSFDAVTMGYGLRNVVDRPKAMRELLRVVKPRGKVAILDFNNTTDPLADGVQAFFLENLVVPAAEAEGVADEYRYLRPSIKAFPTGREQEAMALEAGFVKATHYEVGFGLMGCLVAEKGRF